MEAEVKDLIPGQLSTRCVVKILRPESTAAQHSKFLKDVQPLLKLDHPHVLKLYSCCLEAAPFLIILQHCPNGDLKQFLAAYSPSRGYDPKFDCIVDDNRNDSSIQIILIMVLTLYALEVTFSLHI